MNFTGSDKWTFFTTPIPGPGQLRRVNWLVLHSLIFVAVVLVIAAAFMLWPLLADARHWFPRKKTKKFTNPLDTGHFPLEQLGKFARDK
jgi:hypothetical protein